MAHPSKKRAHNAVYICGTLGVPDIDRCNHLVSRGWNVEAFHTDKTSEYIWDRTVDLKFRSRAAFGSSSLLLMRLILSRPDVVLVYGYTKPLAFVFSLLCLVAGRRAVSMNDSKFDDYERNIYADLIKLLYLWPYRGFLTASERASQYLRYLGLRRPMLAYRCAIDTARIANLSAANPKVPFRDLSFLIVGRFVEKKNYFSALRAYELYRQAGGHRSLKICGYGPLENDIRAAIDTSAILRANVSIISPASTSEIASALSSSVALILASTEEQFGIVVTEAMACGVPAIISDNCGACDIFHTGFGGFKVEANSARGMAYFMDMLSSDETFWQQQRSYALECARTADVAVFGEAVETFSKG